MLVGAKLKSIVQANGMEFPKHLNEEFQDRLNKITGMPPDKFDAAYIMDMEKIHHADGAAFAKEAAEGSNPDLKAFAAETYRIVQRISGSLARRCVEPGEARLPGLPYRSGEFSPAIERSLRLGVIIFQQCAPARHVTPEQS